MDQLLTALVGFAGVALGAVIQFILDRRSIREIRSVEMKADAYAEYLKAVSVQIRDILLGFQNRSQ